MGFYVPEIRKNHQPELVSLQLNDVIQNSVYNNISFGSIYSQITTPYSGTGNPAYAGVQETPFSEIYTLRTTPAKDSEAAKFRLPLMTYAANMHPIMKTILKVAAAFGAALAIPHLGIGLADTLIWFGIGAVRSYVTQMVVKRGWDPRQWNLRYFDYNNAADAMLFTGLYIPTLNILDKLNEPGILKAGILTIGNAFFYTRIHNLFNSFSEEVAKKNLAPALAGGLASVTFDAYFTPQIALILGLPVVIASKIIYDLISFSLDSLYMSRDFLPERKENLALILDDFTKTKGEEKLHNFVDLLYEYAAAPKGKKALEEILTGSSTEAAQIKALRKFNNASQNIKRIHVYLQTLCGDDREKYTRLTGTFDHAIKDLPEFLSQIATRKRKKSITEIQKEFTKNLRIITDNLDIINQRRAYISNSAIKQSQATINTELEIIIKSVANSYSVIGANLDTSLSDHATAIALLAAVKKIAKSHRLQLESYVKKLEESKIDFMQREEYQPVIQKIMNILYYTKKELPSQKP